MKLFLCVFIIQSYLGFVAGQDFVCADNPFVKTESTGGSVDCGSISNQSNCWDEIDCIYADSSTQILPACVDLPVVWPDLTQTWTVTFRPTASSSSTSVNVPPTQYSCIPGQLSQNVGCYDRAASSPEDYAFFIGILAGPSFLNVDLSLNLQKSTYVATSVFPVNPTAPRPLNQCVYKSLGTTMLLSLDPAQDYMIAIRVKKKAESPDIFGDNVMLKLSSIQEPWPRGDGRPIADPNNHTCPINWSEAVQTQCGEIFIGNCLYNYTYTGCDYLELRCKQSYICNCAPFLGTFRCWGDLNPPTCGPNTPTVRDGIWGRNCNPRRPLPQSPDPIPPVCPATRVEAEGKRCDGRIPRCDYNYAWFGCFPGELMCVSNQVCECDGVWRCYTSQKTCSNTTRRRDPLVGTPCDPARL